MSRATRYSAKDYALTVANVTLDSGRGADTFVEIAGEEDDFGYQAGLDGEGVFFSNPKKYTILTVYMMQTSQANAVLSALHLASLAAEGIMYPVSGQDSRGTSKIVSEAAMILKMPDEVYAKEPGVTAWRIGVHKPDRFVGGH